MCYGLAATMLREALEIFNMCRSAVGLIKRLHTLKSRSHLLFSIRQLNHHSLCLLAITLLILQVRRTILDA